MLDICIAFPISNEEFSQLDEKFSRLCWHAAHELKRKNSKNNFTDDPEDIKQELQMSMLRAGSYYKRQTYIENCLSVVKKYAKDGFMQSIINELADLWDARTHHGANRQKFGKFQEQLLDRIVRRIVPKQERPDINEKLKIDLNFANYCKSIVWNGQKSMGKKITREKSIRNNLVSLSEFSFLG